MPCYSGLEIKFENIIDDEFRKSQCQIRFFINRKVTNKIVAELSIQLTPCIINVYDTEESTEHVKNIIISCLGMV